MMNISMPAVYFMIFVLVVLPVYLICAVPFGLVLTKLFLKTDIRKIGSGNTGATNVLRTGSRWLALATLLLDAAKPVAAYWFLIWIYGGPADFSDSFQLKILVSVVAVLAHCYPVYLRFRGGKGVATAWGTMWLFSSAFALVSIAVWIAVIAATRKSSLSALAAALLVPFWAHLFAPGAEWLYSAMVLFVVWRHRENIRRLVSGAESRVDFGAKGKHVRR